MTQLTDDDMSKLRGSYQDALQLLATRARKARPVESAGKHETGPTPGLRGEASITGMQKWIEVLGHSVGQSRCSAPYILTAKNAALKSLNTIHVAGTKGKGSTCAFVESLLRAHGRRTGFPRKTGMYTGPSLLTDRERIRLNFEPISEEMLAKHTFELHNALEEARSSDRVLKSPRRLQMWVLLAFHTFVKEEVDVAIVETNHGGEYDSTNFLREPVVTAITTLGMDHVQQLGPTQSDIAWHKAGIFKPGAAAISAPQVEDAIAVLVERAQEKSVILQMTDPTSLPAAAVASMPSDVFHINCSVAVAAVNAWLTRLNGQQLSEEDILEGVAGFSWPGRFQHLTHGREQWYLDAAHNTLSMSKAARWFAQVTSHASSAKLLIFAHISDNRDGAEVLLELLRSLREHNVQLAAVVLCPYTRLYDAQCRARWCVTLTVADRPAAGNDSLPGLWKTYKSVLAGQYASTEVHTADTVDEAVSIVQSLADAGQAESHILATGSQHLLGGVLHILEGS